MVMVLVLLAHALVADHRLPRFHTLHEPELLQLVDDPVDACAAHAPLRIGAQGVLDLGGGERAALTREQLEHGAARAAALAPGVGERRLGPLDPARARHVRMVEIEYIATAVATIAVLGGSEGTA